MSSTQLNINCLEILKGLKAHNKNVWVFSTPIDPTDRAPLGMNDYFDIIKKPMDLRTIQKNLEAGSYHSFHAFQSDVLLTFENGMKYNEEGVYADSRVYGWAKDLKEKFTIDFNNLMKKLGIFLCDQSIQSKFDLPFMLEKIESEEFIQFAEQSHLVRPTVEVNPHLLASDMYQKFLEEGKSCAEQDVDNHYRIVFYGTPEHSIESILRNGIDPLKRSDHDYGPGEYFASNPALPMRLCQGSKKILAFVVITPPDVSLARNVIVVDRTERQIPIATISFDDLSTDGWDAANAFHAQVTKLLLSKKNEMDAILEHGKSKEKIIRLLIAGEYATASEVYNKIMRDDGENGWPVGELWVKEVAVYVHDNLRDAAQVDIYFPNLPPRPIEADNVPILNIEKCKADANDAKRKYETASNGNTRGGS